MNEAQKLQRMARPDWKPGEVRLVSLTYVLDDPGLSTLQAIKCCQTLAASLDEAVQRAEKHYGPGSLNGWGVQTLPTDSVLYGGGELLRGKRDFDYQDAFIRIYP